MTTIQCLGMSVNVNNTPIQDYNHLDDHIPAPTHKWLFVNHDSYSPPVQS